MAVVHQRLPLRLQVLQELLLENLVDADQNIGFPVDGVLVALDSNMHLFVLEKVEECFLDQAAVLIVLRARWLKFLLDFRVDQVVL